MYELPMMRTVSKLWPCTIHLLFDEFDMGHRLISMPSTNDRRKLFRVEHVNVYTLRILSNLSQDLWINAFAVLTFEEIVRHYSVTAGIGASSF